MTPFYWQQKLPDYREYIKLQECFDCQYPYTTFVYNVLVPSILEIASCDGFSYYYRFSDIAINSVNPSFIWRNHFALQELNISQNNFHLSHRASWVPFSLARRCISLAPGNRATVNVEPCWYQFGTKFKLVYLCYINPCFW
jgi:hypothetical protein